MNYYDGFFPVEPLRIGRWYDSIERQVGVDVHSWRCWTDSKAFMMALAKRRLASINYFDAAHRARMAGIEHVIADMQPQDIDWWIAYYFSAHADLLLDPADATV